MGLEPGDSLLLSRASPFPRRKGYAPVGSSIPVTLPRVVIRERRIPPVQGSSGEMRTPRVVCTDRRNMGIFSMESFQGTCCCINPEKTPSLKSRLGAVRPGAANAPSANARARKLVCGQRSKHGSDGISGIPKVFLQCVSASKPPSRNPRHDEGWVEYERVFIAEVAFGVVESYLNKNARPSVDQEHCDFDIFVCQREEGGRPVSCDAGKLYDQGQLHTMSLVIEDYLD